MQLKVSTMGNYNSKQAWRRSRELPHHVVHFYIQLSKVYIPRRSTTNNHNLRMTTNCCTRSSVISLIFICSVNKLRVSRADIHQTVPPHRKIRIFRASVRTMHDSECWSHLFWCNWSCPIPLGNWSPSHPKVHDRHSEREGCPQYPSSFRPWPSCALVSGVIVDSDPAMSLMQQIEPSAGSVQSPTEVTQSNWNNPSVQRGWA